MQLHYKIASEADIKLLQDLSSTIWQAHYPGIISQAQIDYMLQEIYATETLQKELQMQPSYTLIFTGDTPIGYYQVYENKPRHFFLHKFYLLVSEHHKGIGSRAFAHLLANVAIDYETIRLQVNRRNVKAINFYFKHGFRILFAKDFDFGNGYTMEDFVMEKRA